MSSEKHVSKGGTGEKKSEDDEKQNISKSAKAADLERIRQNLAKRSLDVKFDLQGSDYKPVENIGIGAYGVVCSAVHRKSGDRVAIKKIPCVFEAITIAKRTYREIKILKHFKHDNIISIREILMPKENVNDFKDIYVVFDLMESDLHRIIYSKQELSDEHIRYFLYQILRGLKYIHSANVIHRDLKPSNLLVNEDCHLRIGDFGMARGVFYTPDEPSYYMTQYVATRWYRAPEILLSMLEYGAAVDMWSVGCIFAEMMGRKHLFPGKDYISQVKLILGVLGTPSEAVLKNCHNDILRRIIKGLGKKDPLPWDKLFPKVNKKSIDLLSRMLVLHPADRISVEQALSHRLLNNYHDPDDEPICVPTFHFDFEKQDMDQPKLREVIMAEIMGFHQPKQPTFSFNAFLRPAPKLNESASKDVKAESPERVSSTTGDTGGIQKVEQAKEAAFKPPVSAENKPSTKVSPVSVDVSKLQVAASADIEMLSAQSTDGKAMETQNTEMILVNKVKHRESEVPVEDKKALGEKDITKAAAVDKKGGNTISEDTKALVKQALMNATQRRQRAESLSEESKDSKPVTAAQRQKEREEKRRRKKERALEKVKKTKDKRGGQDQSVTLSNQDMELLRRWTVMQNPVQSDQNSNSPPHPGPAATPPQATNSSAQGGTQNVEVMIAPKQSSCSSQVPSTANKPRQILAKTTAPTAVTLATNINITSNQMTTGGTVIIPSTQLSLSQANFIPVIAIPSAVDPGKIEIKRLFQPSDLTAHTLGTTIASTAQPVDTTKNLLQNAILMRNRGNSTSSVVQNVPSQQVLPEDKPPSVIHTDRNTSTNLSFPSNITGNMGNKEEIDAQANNIPTNQFTAAAAKHSDILKQEENDISKDDKLSPGSQGNQLLDFLNKHLKDSPTENRLKENSGNTTSMQPLYHGSSFIQNQCMQEQNSSFSIQGPSRQDSTQPPPPPPYNSYSQTQTSEKHLSQTDSLPAANVPNHSSEHPQQTSVPLQLYNNQPFSSSFPNQSGFPSEFHAQDRNTNQQQTFSHQSSSNFSPGFINQNSYQNFPQNASVMPFNTPISHADMLFQTSDFSSQLHQQQQQQQHSQQDQHQQHLPMQLGNSGTYSEFHNFSSVTSSSSSTMHFDQNFSNFPVSQPQQGHFTQNQTFTSNQFAGLPSHSHNLPQHIHGQAHSMANIPMAASGSNSAAFSSSSILQPSTSMDPGPSTSGLRNPGHRLTVNCSSTSRPDVPHADLEHLSKLFSKQHVVDSFPPALALTPRGTGAGYGVGMDLDNMLTDAQDHAGVRVEHSPLSSSLLQDWLDISGISQADLEALEREYVLQSPMNVSYNDHM